MPLFQNRLEAAEELATDLAFLKSENPVVLGIPNGGVPIAQIIARALDAPLDILLISRLSAPKNPDHIVGAVDEHGRISMIQSTARWHHLTSQEMVEPAREVFRLLQTRRGRFRAVLPEVPVRGRTVIIVDQGVDTGATMLGAIASVKDNGATKVIVAAPAGQGKSTWQLHAAADTVVIPHAPTHFKGIDHFYSVLPEVTDARVVEILSQWVESRGGADTGVKTLVLKLKNNRDQLLCCELDLPPGTERGSGPFPAVMFAHGFESNAASDRNVTISRRLAKRNIIGVRLDFTGHGRSEGTTEEATELQMLADLRTIFDQVITINEVDADRVGVNGSGTGAMISLHFAAREPRIAALVIRGPICGNERDAARHVEAPTLIIHADRDTALARSVEELDQEIHGSHQLLVIKEANRLFADPISKEMMVAATVDWFVDHFGGLGGTGITADQTTQQPTSKA